MCRFLSAVVSRTGEIYCNPLIDSHEDIIDYFNIQDTQMQHIVRVEFFPIEKEDLINIDRYNLKVDEQEIPEWFNEHKESVIERLKLIIKNCILKESRKIAIGAVIIGDGITVHRLINANVKFAGNSTIKDAGNSTIKDAGYSTIENAGHSTIKDARYSTIENAGNSTIKDAGHSTIKDAGNSTIEDAGNSTIEDAGNSTIEDAGYSTIINK